MSPLLKLTDQERPAPVAAMIGPRPRLSLGSIWRWALLGAAPILLAAIAAFVSTMFIQQTWAARSEILFLLGNASGDVAQRFLATQQVLATGHAVLAPVAETFHIAVDDLEKNISADLVKTSTVMRLEFHDHRPDVALEVTRSVTERYLAALRGVEIGSGAQHQLLVPAYQLSEPISPRPLQAAALGGVVGLAIVAAALLLRGQARRS